MGTNVGGLVRRLNGRALLFETSRVCTAFTQADGSLLEFSKPYHTVVEFDRVNVLSVLTDRTLFYI